MGRYPKLWPVGGHAEGEAKVRQLKALGLPWARASGPGWVAEKQGNFANVKHGEPKPLYVDSGWLDDAGTGWPEQAGGGRFSITATADCAGSYQQLAQRLKVNRGVLLKHLIKDTFKNNGARSGRSFGIGVSYDGTAQDVEDAKERDAAQLKMKMQAMPFIGTSTGLMRCFAKGLIGRPLRLTPEITFAWEGGIPLVQVDGMTFSPWYSGVLVGEFGFSIVQIVGSTANIVPLATPNTLRPLWREFKELLADPSASAQLRASAATYLLAYAKPKGDVYSIEITGEPVKTTILHGWRFALFGNACVATEIALLGAAGVGFTVQTISFHEEEAVVEDKVVPRFAAVAQTIETDNVTSGGMPAVWIPDPSVDQLIRLTGFITAPPSTTSRPPLNAYFDHDDALVVVRIGLPENAGLGPVTPIESSASFACGSGTSFEIDGTKQENERKKLVSVSKPEDVTVTDYDTVTLENVYTYTVPELVLEESSVTIGAPGACETVILGVDLTTPGHGAHYTYKGWYGEHTRDTTDKTTDWSEDAAVILPYFFTDTCMYVVGDEEVVTTLTERRVNSASMQAIEKRMPEGFPQYPLERAYYAVASAPPFLGGGIDNVVTDSTINEVVTTRNAIAPVFTGSGMERVNAITDSATDEYPPLSTYFDGTTMFFMPFIVHSLHGDSWGSVHALYGNHLVTGEEWIVGRTPIGVE